MHSSSHFPTTLSFHFSLALSPFYKHGYVSRSCCGQDSLKSPMPEGRRLKVSGSIEGRRQIEGRGQHCGPNAVRASSKSNN